MQVVDQVHVRIEATREPGVQAGFAGREVGPDMSRDVALSVLNRARGLGRRVSGTRVQPLPDCPGVPSDCQPASRPADRGRSSAFGDQRRHQCKNEVRRQGATVTGQPIQGGSDLDTTGAMLTSPAG